jgi:hypothetical protein
MTSLTLLGFSGSPSRLTVARMRSKCPPPAHLPQRVSRTPVGDDAERRTPLRTRGLAAAMREEAPREQQDRRAYISKEYMAGCAGFYRHSGRGPKEPLPAEARHGGKNKFSRLQVLRDRLRHLPPFVVHSPMSANLFGIPSSPIRVCTQGMRNINVVVTYIHFGCM